VNHASAFHAFHFDEIHFMMKSTRRQHQRWRAPGKRVATFENGDVPSTLDWKELGERAKEYRAGGPNDGTECYG